MVCAPVAGCARSLSSSVDHPRRLAADYAVTAHPPVPPTGPTKPVNAPPPAGPGRNRENLTEDSPLRGYVRDGLGKKWSPE